MLACWEDVLNNLSSKGGKWIGDLNGQVEKIQNNLKNRESRGWGDIYKVISTYLAVKNWQM